MLTLWVKSVCTPPLHPPQPFKLSTFEKGEGNLSALTRAMQLWLQISLPHKACAHLQQTHPERKGLCSLGMGRSVLSIPLHFYGPRNCHKAAQGWCGEHSLVLCPRDSKEKWELLPVLCREPEFPTHDSIYPPGRIRALLCSESTRQTRTPHCLHQGKSRFIDLWCIDGDW